MRKYLAVPRKFPATALALLAVVGLVAGCGDSSDSNDANVGSAAESKSPEIARAEARLEPFLTPPKAIAVTEPLKERPTGKEIAYLECGAPPCKQISAGLKGAAPALGVRLKVIQAGGTPESFQAAAQRAVAERPAAVLMPAIDATLIKSQLAAMKARNILRVAWATAAPPPDAFDVYFLSPVTTRKLGEALANYAIANSSAKAKVLFVNQSVFSFSKPMSEGVKNTLARGCRQCTYSTIDTLPQDVAKKIPEQIVSKLQSEPSIDWVIFGYGGMTLGVPQALRAAGLDDRVKILEPGPLKHNYVELKAGREQAATDINYELFGYYAIDSVARALTGQSVPELQDDPMSYLITGEDITFDPNKAVYNPIPGYQQQFRKVWGVE